jgi:ATP-dependent Clp protease ATP-binding subunit ClpA
MSEGKLFDLTPRAQWVWEKAHKEAVRLNHDRVDPEHLLLAVLHLEQGVAFNVLLMFEIDIASLRETIEKRIGVGESPEPTGSLPYSSRARAVTIDGSDGQEKLDLPWSGTEHLLLGMLRERAGVAAEVLREFGVEAESARREIRRVYDPSAEGMTLGASTSEIRRALFTPNAQEALRLARSEADRRYNNFIGTGHLLFGLIRLGRGTGWQSLITLDVEPTGLADEVERQLASGPLASDGSDLPLTPWCEKCTALAAEEAQASGRELIGTGHLLLGLLREGQGLAARVLLSYKLDPERSRQTVLAELGISSNAQSGSGPGASES